MRKAVADASVPDGWAPTTMSALGTLFCGTSPTTATVNKTGDGTPYVSGPEQWDGHTLHLDKWTTEPRRIVPDGCIFITVKGAGVGKLFPGQAVAIGRDIYAFLPHKGIDRRLVQNALQFTIYDLVRQAKGDIPGLSKPHILEHAITLPPEAEQTRIADRIDELFTDLAAGVAALERVRKKLKRYRSAVLHAAVTGRLTEAWRKEHGLPYESGEQLLERLLIERRRQWEERTLADYEAKGRKPPKDWRQRYQEPVKPRTDDLPELPRGWCWATFDQAYQSVRNGTATVPRQAGGTPILRISAVRPLSVDLEDVRYITREEADEADAWLADDDLLFTRYNGSAHLCGVCGRVRSLERPTVHPDKLIRCRVVSSDLSATFLEITANAGPTRSIIESKLRTTAGQVGVSGSDIKAASFPLAPMAEQAEIVDKVEEKLSQIETMEAEVERGLARATRLRQAILKAAFAGELVPQDPKDEPALVLLERIRTEREAMAAQSNGRPSRNDRGKSAPRKKVPQTAKKRTTTKNATKS